MAIPVLQALANVRMQEASAFGKWCIQRNLRSLPAAPAHVAAFVRDCEPMLPIDKIWELVNEVSQTHLANGLADPTAGGVVAATMNSIANIDPPRSWPKELWPRFDALPYDLQAYLAVREKETNRVVRRAQNEAADARKALAAIENRETKEHGTNETETGQDVA